MQFLKPTRAIALASLLLLGACAGAEGAGEPAAAPPQSGDIRLPGKSNSDSLVLFNRYRQRLLTFDPDAQAIDEMSNVLNYLQYEFPTGSDLYTAGHSITNGFSVVQVVDETIQTVLEVADDEGIFPLATDGDRSFFLLTRYVDGAEVDRRLVRLDEGAALVEYPNATGLIDGGALVGDTLYYTVFREQTGDYALFQADAGDPAAQPVAVQQGMPSGRLYVHDGELYTSDQTSIFRGDDRFECADLCYFYDDLGVLVRIAVNADSDLALDVVDTDTKEVIGSVTGVIDFRVGDGGVTVYTPGSIETVEVPAA